MSTRKDNNKKDDNKGGSYRESYGDRHDKKEDKFTNEKGGWESDRSGAEREGYGLKKNYDNGKVASKKVKGKK